MLSIAIKQVVSLVSALWVIVNLTFWLIPLLVLTLFRPFLSANVIGGAYARLIAFIYKGAAALDSFWMLRVIGVDLRVTGEMPAHTAPIVLANHQTWFDIPILQEVVCSSGPILKFMIKRELAWVPIIGWICLALNFPRLHRGKGGTSTSSDYDRVRDASVELSSEPGALLIFPEGTRFTNAKHDKQASPYEHLLRPRAGGLRILHESAPPDTPVVDITIIYSNPEANFWNCLHGASPAICVNIEVTRLGDIDDIPAWLDASWKKKDALLGATRMM